MKKAFFMLCLAFSLTLSFAFTPVERICNDEAVTVCSDETSTVSMDEMFGTGTFYGCFASSVPATVTYQLIPTIGPGIISGTISCNTDIVTLSPFVQYDVWVTTDQHIWLYLRWNFCGVGGGVPGLTLNPPGTYNVGSIFITC